MNEKSQGRSRYRLLLFVAGLAVVLVCFFWPAEKGRVFRRAVFDGNLDQVKRLAEKWPALVNSTNSELPKVSSLPSTGGQSIDGFDRLVLDIFEELTHIRTRNNKVRPDPFQMMEDGGLTPLQIALVGKNPEMARALLERGADVRVASAQGMTALHYATLNDHSAGMISLLLEKGAVLEATNVYSLTPLYFSILTGNERSARTLLKAGANPNAQLRDGGSVLHLAAVRPGPRLVPLLIQHGANPAHTNRNGQTPLDLARQRKIAHAIQQLSVENGTPP